MEVCCGSLYVGRCTCSYILDHMLLQEEKLPLRAADPLSIPDVPLIPAFYPDDAEATSQGSFHLVDESVRTEILEHAGPAQYTCTICNAPYKVPYIHCYFCEEEEPEHHGGCCNANPTCREGDETKMGRLRRDLMRARTSVMKLTADLKDEKDRTDMFAK